MGTERRESIVMGLSRGGAAGLVGIGAMSALLIAAGASGVVKYEPPRKRSSTGSFPSFP